MKTLRINCQKCDNLLDGAHKSYCLSCAREIQKEWRLANPEKYKKQQRMSYQKHRKQRIADSHRIRLKSRFGLTVEEFEQMRINQNDICPICHNKMIKGSSDKRGMAIDHNHATNVVRDLLCQSCNRGLGIFDEDIDSLKRAIEYLIKWSDVK